MKALLFSISLICIHLSVNLVMAQAPEILWTKTIGGAENEGAVNVFPADDGGFIIGGTTQSFGSSDFYLLKTDEWGDVVWDITYGDNDRFEAMDAMIEVEGGFLMAGRRAKDPPNQSQAEVYLIKIDKLGNFTWSSVIGEDLESITPSSIAQTPDGFIMCGSKWVNPQSVYDIVLIKTDTIGLLQWSTYIGFEEGKADYAEWIEVSPDNEYLVCGRTQAYNDNYDDDAFIMKTDNTGFVMWMVKHGEPLPYYEGGNHLLKASDGGYLISGHQNNDALDNNWFIVKTNEMGEKVWDHIIGGIYHDKAFGACETNDNGFAVTGSYHQNTWMGFVAKYSADGDTLWTKLWGDPDLSTTNYIIKQLDDGGYVTLGTIKPAGGKYDLFLSRLSADITNIDPTLGQSFHGPIEFTGIQPNPFNSATSVCFEVHSVQHVEVLIYDITGNRVASLLNETKTPGSYVVEFNENVRPGMYYCVIRSESASLAKKLIRIKS